MELTSAERNKVLEMIADRLANEALKEISLKDYILIPLSTAGAWTGLGPKQASRRMPTKKMGEGKLGISITEIEKYQKQQEPATT